MIYQLSYAVKESRGVLNGASGDGLVIVKIANKRYAKIFVWRSADVIDFMGCGRCHEMPME